MGSGEIFFTEKLLEWNKEQNNRNMPWKGEKDPYRIWLSEIILQQTRVEQGWPYYERFISHYPTVQQLAAAPEEEVFRLWQGLGYYARCKNMLAAARDITENHGGKFPSTYEQIKSLKGIGPYTAAAIASFAFNLPHAVLDGNVYRVLARFFGIDTPIDSHAGKKQFAGLAQSLLPTDNAASYNQSIMDFGAVVCKPQQPACDDCPLQKKCVACHQQLISLLPVKTKKIQVKKRYFNYIILQHNDNIYIRKRTANDIWQNLHEFILVETDSATDITALQSHAMFKQLLGNIPFSIEKVSAVSKQQLTHQTIFSQFITLRVADLPTLNGYIPVQQQQLNNYAFPKTITTYLERNSLQLF
ncbi:A/G-specific DNA-adenine glycosylase [Chitinophaga terrae (ex Kim and Jung 2007)]|uniref:Adenine DNA glycosylase n=1 Tax=Chitinophaga terrae (ex Kim and Jung 2007) TaxID=408074 RepID=A0A1H4G7D4_9BACT|nr:A/G-specific adenine glycosylase [Chitinophaga terrae (ex Kim and Jung 2007)]GEP93120.1 A/G-specific adenine glycosylase [Chitinophaga terrae (ex Kim and Jung 2007)]SEB04940.1 A/G-specific DNA-adenine glycosylase [Chitinophaga terrae (ex Kim and Jung 2007)]